MNFLTRSLRYSLMATTALTLNTLTPAWAADDDVPLVGPQRQDHTIGKQLEDARAEKKLHEWEGGIGGAFYHFECRGNITIVNAILSMHIANTEQGMSRQDSAQKLFTYFLNMYEVTDECDNRIPNGLVEVWNDLDEASRKRHIRSIMSGDNEKDKLLLDLLIQSGGHGITIAHHQLPQNPLQNADWVPFMKLVTKIGFLRLPDLPWGETLDNLTAHYPNIHSFQVMISDLGDTGAQNLARTLTEYPRITSLILHYNQIGAAGAIALAGNTTLQELDLTHNQIGDAGAIALAGNTTLRKLRLGFNQIGDAGAVALAGNTALRELKLNRNQIGNAGAIALAGNRSLRELDLGSNQIGDAGGIALAGNTALRELNLSYNNIGNAGAIALAGNRTLLKLNLVINLIGDAGAMALARNTALRELNLEYNQIGVAGAQEFLSLLIQNKSPLKKLSIRANNISQPTKDEFRAWATANGVELKI